MPKYWGKQIFSLREFPRSGSKAKDGEKEERKLVITMASYALQTPPRVVHAKPLGPIDSHDSLHDIPLTRLQLEISMIAKVG